MENSDRDETIVSKPKVVEGFLGFDWWSCFGVGGCSWCICVLIALFFMFKCKEKFSWIGAIVAILCPCCYLLYIGITQGTCDGYVRGRKPSYKK